MINLGKDSNGILGPHMISEPPHPPKEKYFHLGPQHPPKVKYSLTAVQTGKGAGWLLVYHQTCFPTWTGMLRTSLLPGLSIRRDWSSTS